MHPQFWCVKNVLSSKFGEKLPFADFIQFAHHVSKQIHAPLDRMATRSKKFTIAWFCEHWEDAEPFVNEYQGNVAKKLNREIIANQNRVAMSWPLRESVQQKLQERLNTKLSMTVLRDYALFVADLLDIHLERNAKRNKDVLIAWFCENWEKIKYLETTEPIQHEQTPQCISSSDCCSPLFNDELEINSLEHIETEGDFLFIQIPEPQFGEISPYIDINDLEPQPINLIEIDDECWPHIRC